MAILIVDRQIGQVKWQLLEQTTWYRVCVKWDSTVVWLWCLYLTIIQQVWVVYEQIVNETQPSWLSLIHNDCESSNCFRSAEGRICNIPLVGLYMYWISLGCPGSSSATRNVVVSSPNRFVPDLFVPKPFRPRSFRSQVVSSPRVNSFILYIYIIYLIYRIQIPMAMDYYGKTVDKSDITFERKARIALATVVTFQLIQTLFSRTIKTFPLLIVSHRSLKE